MPTRVRALHDQYVRATRLRDLERGGDAADLDPDLGGWGRGAGGGRPFDEGGEGGGGEEPDGGGLEAGDEGQGEGEGGAPVYEADADGEGTGGRVGDGVGGEEGLGVLEGMLEGCGVGA